MEKCKNGHVRTEENTSWVKRGDRPGKRRRCLDCKRGKYLKGGTPAHEKSIQITDAKHEDLEDLIRFGATFEEIMERGGYASWGGMVRSLKVRGRDDLIAKLWHKKELGGANRPLHPTMGAKKKKRGRHSVRHLNVHDLPKELEALIY